MLMWMGVVALGMVVLGMLGSALGKLLRRRLELELEAETRWTIPPPQPCVEESPAEVARDRLRHVLLEDRLGRRAQERQNALYAGAAAAAELAAETTDPCECPPTLHCVARDTLPEFALESRDDELTEVVVPMLFDTAITAITTSSGPDNDNDDRLDFTGGGGDSGGAGASGSWDAADTCAPMDMDSATDSDICGGDL